MSLLSKEVQPYKPFKYPWAYDYWYRQQKMHWLAEEVPMTEDVQDWKAKLSPQERNLVTQILRFFTVSDIEVNNCYHQHYLKVFTPIEVKMMLTAFSNTETIHVQAYSHLIDTLGLPEVEYEAFLHYKEMKDKFDYMHGFNTNSKHDIAKTLAAFSAFTEGLQLFASFVILLNFTRFGKLKGLGQIVAWSQRDEQLHVNGVLQLYKTFLDENPKVWDNNLREDIYQICKTTVEHEDAFIDLAFEQGGIEGLTKEEVKEYIRYIADRRLIQLGMPKQYHFNVRTDPLPWANELVNGLEFTNFFENKSTEYSKASTTGTWEDIWSN